MQKEERERTIAVADQKGPAKPVAKGKLSSPLVPQSVRAPKIVEEKAEAQEVQISSGNGQAATARPTSDIEYRVNPQPRPDAVEVLDGEACI